MKKCKRTTLHLLCISCKCRVVLHYFISCLVSVLFSRLSLWLGRFWEKNCALFHKRVKFGAVVGNGTKTILAMDPPTNSRLLGVTIIINFRYPTNYSKSWTLLNFASPKMFEEFSLLNWQFNTAVPSANKGNNSVLFTLIVLQQLWYTCCCLCDTSPCPWTLMLGRLRVIPTSAGKQWGTNLLWQSKSKEPVKGASNMSLSLNTTRRKKVSVKLNLT